MISRNIVTLRGHMQEGVNNNLRGATATDAPSRHRTRAAPSVGARLSRQRHVRHLSSLGGIDLALCEFCIRIEGGRIGRACQVADEKRMPAQRIHDAMSSIAWPCLIVRWCTGLPAPRLSVNMQGKDIRYDTARFIFCRGFTRTR